MPCIIELGDPGIASQHGKAQRRRSADLSVRRPRTHRLGSHQEPPVARAIGLELEGCPHDACSGRRMSTQRRSKPSPTKHPPMTEVAMPLNELDLWLQARVGQGAPATDLSMLDGYVAASVAGPVSMDPRLDLPAAGCRQRGLRSRRHCGIRGNIRRRGSAQRHRQHALDCTSRLCADLRTQTERRYRCGFLVQRLLCCNPAESLSLGAAADQRWHRKRPAPAHPVPLRRSKWSPADPVSPYRR